MKKILFILFASVLSFNNLFSQDTINVSPDTLCVSRSILSPEITADSCIIFRLYAPNAKHVKVVSDCFVKSDKSWFGGQMKQRKMRKCADGVWTYKTKKLKPEVYNYRFVVDGEWTEDPLNADSTYVLLHKESVAAVGGSEYADLYTEQHAPLSGTIDTVEVYSEEQQVSRMVLVYLPYNARTDSLPLLYLLHGISGDETSWIEAGRVKQILDNMISQQLIQPMIVVMPDCNAMNKIAPKRRTNLMRNIFNYPILNMGDFEKAFPTMYQYILDRYPVKRERELHTIAGLSSGAKQAANIVRDYPYMFYTLGLFSPVVHREQLPTVGEDIRVFVFIGKGDLFYATGKDYAKMLKKQHTEYELHQTPGGHTWKSWRTYIIDFMKITSALDEQAEQMEMEMKMNEESSTNK